MNHHSAMQDKSIDGALLALRKQIIRGQGDGLDHVEALLRLRGVDMPYVCPKRVNVARRGEAQRIALDALRDGPKTLREVAAYMAERRPGVSPEAALPRAGLALNKLRKAGAVRRDGRVWSLTALAEHIG